MTRDEFQRFLTKSDWSVLREARARRVSESPNSFGVFMENFLKYREFFYTDFFLQKNTVNYAGVAPSVKQFAGHVMYKARREGVPLICRPKGNTVSFDHVSIPYDELGINEIKLIELLAAETAKEFPARAVVIENLTALCYMLRREGETITTGDEILTNDALRRKHPIQKEIR